MNRKLSDFEPLSPAEQQIRDEICSEPVVVLGDGSLPPEGAGEGRQVRADFLRYLILGGCAALPGAIPEHGVRVRGAVVMGKLDLYGAVIGGDVLLSSCRFDTAPVMMSTRLANLNLTESTLPGLYADRLQARGNVVLDGVQSTGELRLLGVKLGGDLDCENARLKAGESSRALNANRAQITGGFFLRDGARIKGVLDLTAARIGDIYDDADCWPDAGNLLLDRCRYGAFTGGPVEAGARIRWLDLQDPARWGKDFWPQPWEHCAKVLREMGHVEDARQVLIAKEDRQRRWQRDKLKARLAGARLRLRAERPRREDLDALNADIQSAGSAHEGPMLAEVTAQLRKARVFTDQALSKKVQDRAAFAQQLRPRFDRLEPAFPGGAASGFDPAMNARGVVVETWLHLTLRRLLDGLLLLSIAYGHRPFRAVSWLVGFWLLGALLFGIAAGQDAIKPNNAFILRSPEWTACHPDYISPNDSPRLAARWEEGYRSQLDCFTQQPEAAGYPRFNALVYSADTLLPIVAMEMQDYWIPDEAQGPRGRWTRYFLWLQIAMGWALSLLAVAGFSGLVKSD